MSKRSLIEQILTGYQVSNGLRMTCHRCRSKLGECSLVTVTAQRVDNACTWTVTACYCLGCAPTKLDQTMADEETVLAEARLGVTADEQLQNHWLVLVDPIVVERTIPEEGQVLHRTAQKDTEGHGDRPWQ